MTWARMMTLARSSMTPVVFHAQLHALLTVPVFLQAHPMLVQFMPAVVLYDHEMRVQSAVVLAWRFTTPRTSAPDAGDVIVTIGVSSFTTRQMSCNPSVT